MARAGQDVTLYARGPHLRAMQESGLRILSADGDFEVRPRVTGDLADAGRVDVIFLGVKAHGLTQLAPQLRPLIGENTTVVSTQNGIPWWYFQVGAGEFTGLPLTRVDPGGVIGSSIDPRRVVGSLVYLGTEIVEPGVIRHTEGNRISLGRAGRQSIRAVPRHCRGADPGRPALPGHNTAFATKSGSSYWATSRSIPSAR